MIPDIRLFPTLSDELMEKMRGMLRKAQRKVLDKVEDHQVIQDRVEKVTYSRLIIPESSICLAE